VGVGVDRIERVRFVPSLVASIIRGKEAWVQACGSNSKPEARIYLKSAEAKKTDSVSNTCLSVILWVWVETGSLFGAL